MNKQGLFRAVFYTFFVDGFMALILNEQMGLREINPYALGQRAS